MSAATAGGLSADELGAGTGAGFLRSESLGTGPLEAESPPAGGSLKFGKELSPLAATGSGERCRRRYFGGSTGAAPLPAAGLGTTGLWSSLLSTSAAWGGLLSASAGSVFPGAAGFEFVWLDQSSRFVVSVALPLGPGSGSDCCPTGGPEFPVPGVVPLAATASAGRSARTT